MQKSLDSTRKQQIVALLSIGGTRTMAAKAVGCHPQTIINTAKADPDFAEQLECAESSPEIRMLKTLAEASKFNVQAAKWGLERIFPDSYRPRQPGSFSVDVMRRLLVELAARLAGQARTDDERRRILSTMTQFGKEMIVGAQPFMKEVLSLMAELDQLTEDSPPGPPEANAVPSQPGPSSSESATPAAPSETASGENPAKADPEAKTESIFSRSEEFLETVPVEQAAQEGSEVAAPEVRHEQ